MPRWTVQDGEQLMVIDVAGSRVSVGIHVGQELMAFVTGPDGIRDMRRKLGLAIGEAEADHESTT